MAGYGLCAPEQVAEGGGRAYIFTSSSFTLLGPCGSRGWPRPQNAFIRMAGPTVLDDHAMREGR